MIYEQLLYQNNLMCVLAGYDFSYYFLDLFNNIFKRGKVEAPEGCWVFWPKFALPCLFWIHIKKQAIRPVKRLTFFRDRISPIAFKLFNSFSNLFLLFYWLLEEFPCNLTYLI